MRDAISQNLSRYWPSLLHSLIGFTMRAIVGSKKRYPFFPKYQYLFLFVSFIIVHIHILVHILNIKPRDRQKWNKIKKKTQSTEKIHT